MNRTKEISDDLMKLFDMLNIDMKFQDLIIDDLGMPHKPKTLKCNYMGIYLFIYEDIFLKIGKVGSKSNARFLSQHYNPDSSNSNLSKSILNSKFREKVGIEQDTVIGEWIKKNTQRIDILIKAEYGPELLGLIETFLHYKYKPIFEGYSSRRNNNES